MKGQAKRAAESHPAEIADVGTLPTTDMSNVEVPPSLSSPMPQIDVPPPRPPAPASSRRRRGLFWGALSVAAGLAIAGGGVAVTTYRNEARPAGVVQRYFQELQAGNASGALGFGAIPDGDRRLLTSSVLQEQIKHGRIGGLSILAQKVDKATASVDFQYSINDGNGTATVTDTVKLIRHDGSWRLMAVAVPVRTQFLGAASRVTLLGGAPPAQTSLLMFPGALPYGFDTSNLRFAKESLVIRFTFTDDTPPSMVVQPTQLAVENIKSALDADFAACLAGKSAQQTLCPMPTGKRGVPGTLRGQPAQAPSSVAQVSVGRDDGGVFEIVAAVKVKGTYQGLDFNNMAATTSFDDTVKLSARAVVTAPKNLTWWYVP